MAIRSLWGELPPADAVSTPITVLREQASLLQEISGGLLKGLVGANSVASNMQLHLYVQVPALNNYIFQLASVSHNPVQVYPAKVEGMNTSNTGEVKDQQEFERWLENLLSSGEVKKVLQSLMSQARSTESE